ncbi:MAG: phosphatidylglycerol lysyltransferase domain-containing protein [Acetivibrio sp.]
MIEFKRPTLEDKTWMEKKIKESDFRGCEYSFGNLYIWRTPSNVKVALVKDLLCFISDSKEKEIVYNYPTGQGNEKEVIELLIEDARKKGFQPSFRGILEEQKEKMEEMFPEKFSFSTNEGEWDYLYPVEKLTTLPGKKYHGKRNHIARFKDAGDWSYEAITEENLSECEEMNHIWCKEYGCGKGESARIEQCAVEQTFRHFKELEFEGGLLRKGGKVIAFSIGEPLNSDTYVVHIEKAFPEIQGAYPMINQQFVEHNMQKFTYVNREEDMGEEGLRKAKMSYKPNPHLKKYVAVLK